MQPLIQDVIHNEHETTGKVVLGVMFHADGNDQARHDLLELLGAGMLQVKVSDPPSSTDHFYECCQFFMDDMEAKVSICQNGKLAALRLRFLPDEAIEDKIRKQDFGDIASEKVSTALKRLEDDQEHAASVVQFQHDKYESRQGSAQAKLDKLQQEWIACRSHVKTSFE